MHGKSPSCACKAMYVSVSYFVATKFVSLGSIDMDGHWIVLDVDGWKYQFNPFGGPERKIGGQK